MGACCCGMGGSSEGDTCRDRSSRPRAVPRPAAASRGEVVEDVPNASVRLATNRPIVVHVPRHLVCTRHHAQQEESGYWVVLHQGRATCPGEAVPQPPCVQRAFRFLLRAREPVPITPQEDMRG